MNFMIVFLLRLFVATSLSNHTAGDISGKALSGDRLILRDFLHHVPGEQLSAQP
jgi:hypothetical protein